MLSSKGGLRPIPAGDMAVFMLCAVSIYAYLFYSYLGLFLYLIRLEHFDARSDVPFQVFLQKINSKF